MRKGFLIAVCISVAAALTGHGVGLGTVALGFHLIPDVETQDGHRAWDLSLSLGITLRLDPKNSIELLAITDSGPTALGTTLTYRNELTEHMSLGAGITALWPITDGAQFRTPLFESFARAAAHTGVGAGVSVEAAASLPILTLAKKTDRWGLFPLAELPSVALAADITLNPKGALELQVTLQPVLLDARSLANPIGRVTDDLLVLPMFSAFTKYVP